LLARTGDLLGLQWTAQAVDLESHRSAQGSSESHALSAEGMALPDVLDLQELAQLVELGQITAIEEWVQGLLAEQPECGPFAEQVREAVHRLDLQGLEDLLADLVKSASARL
jgi:hypothetical protein